MKYHIKIHDTDLSCNTNDLYQWFHSVFSDTQYYWTFDKFDGYWNFRFESEEDKVKFILRWL